MLRWSIISITLLCVGGCSSLGHISLTDTTEKDWCPPLKKTSEIQGNKTPSDVGESPCEERTLSTKKEEHHTKLAGEPLTVEIRTGEIEIIPRVISEPLKALPVPVPEPEVPIEAQTHEIGARERRNEAALNLGTSVVTPSIGDSDFNPFGAFFFRFHNNNDTRRLRAILSGFANFIDFAEGTWNDSGVEGLLHFENVTVPFASNEVINNREYDSTEIEQGYLLGGIGLGWRYKLDNPGYTTREFRNDFDNDFRVQLYYEPGYLYTKRTDNTGEDVVLPPDTFIHQLHLRLHWDSLSRNLIELPHRGIAWGADAMIGRKENWADHRFTEVFSFEREDTRDYLRLSGYFVAATGIPLFSERNSMLLSCYAGWSPSKNWDRFTSFRIGGGPPSGEAEDLNRPIFPGAAFNQFVAEKYVLSTMEYRYEVDDFIFVHVRGTFMWAELGFYEPDHFTHSEFGSALSVGLSTGFVFDSILYLEYAVDDGVIRSGSAGHSFLISISKSFRGMFLSKEKSKTSSELK